MKIRAKSKTGNSLVILKTKKSKINKIEILRAINPAEIYRAKKIKNTLEFSYGNRQRVSIPPNPKRSGNTMIGTRNRKSSTSSVSIAVEFAEDVQGRDKADEAEAHDEHDSRTDLQARSVVGVEPKHVATRTGPA